MKPIRIRFQNLVVFMATILALMGAACSPKVQRNHETSRAEIEAKLNRVLQLMVSRCADPKDRKALQAAELFLKLQGLPMDLVGFMVPINSGSNRAHVSFTLEHFHQTPPDTLASEALEDFHTTGAGSRKGTDG